MAGKYMGDMTFGVNFDISKGISQLKEVQKALSQIGTLTMKDIIPSSNFTDTALKNLQNQAAKISSAMSNSFNTAIGQIDLSKFNSIIGQGAMKDFLSGLAKIGPTGYTAFNSLQKSLTQTNDRLKTTNGFLDKMATTFANTIRWSVATKAIQSITGSIQSAYYFTKDLDRSLNDIRIVTNKSADEMERFALQATKASQSLGKTTTDYTKASLLFYQQGLNDKEVAARTETTLKAANVTGQSAAEVSEQLTAVWNGYRVSAAETEKYVDKLSAVAASTASDLEELSTGMSKVASAANMMGVDIDQLNAQLSTVISVTRQAPETIGAAFKTIYSRMSTIKAGGINEEDGATLTSYTEKMNQFGISVLDSNGKLRDMGSVIEEIGNKWESFSREAQVGLAQAMGGTRQYSNLTALFENWDKYQEALKISQNAEGKLQEQQDIYMDSISAHLHQLTAEAENLYQTLFDEDVVKNFADTLTGVVKIVDNIIKGFGGVQNVLLMIGTTLASVFTPQISQGMTNLLYFSQQKRENRAIAQQGITNTQANADLAKTFYNEKQTEIDQLPANSAHRQQQQEQLDMQRELSEEVRKLDTLYYNNYNTLSEQQKATIQNRKIEIEGIRDQAAAVAGLQETFSKAAERVLQLDDVTSETFKEKTTEIENVKNQINNLNESLNKISNVSPATQMGEKKVEAYNANQTTSSLIHETIDSSKITDLVNQMGSKVQNAYSQFIENIDGKTVEEVQKELDNLKNSLDKNLVKNAGSKSSKLNQAIGKLQTELSTTFDQMTTQAAAQKDRMVNNIVKSVESTEKQLQPLDTIYEDFRKRLPEETRKEVEKTKTDLDAIINELKNKQHISNDLTGEQVNARIAELNSLRKQFLESMIGALKELGIEITQLEGQIKDITQRGQAVNNTAELLKEHQEAIKIARQQQNQALTQTITSGLRAYSVIVNLYNVFSNIKKMKPHEVFLQLSMTLPMLISSVTTVTASFKKFVIAAYTAKMAEKGLTVETVAFGTALKSALPIIGLVSLAITALVKVISWLTSDPVDELAESLENAKKNTEQLKQETEKLKTTYDEIISTFDKFNEASKVMDDAKSSTEEYNKALQESNEAIINLINNNEKLAKYFERNSKGQLVLKSEYTLEDLKAEANADYQSSQRREYRSEIIQRNLQYEKDVRDAILNERGIGIKQFTTSVDKNTGKLNIRNTSGAIRADVLTDIVKNANGPMTKEEMTEAFEKALDINRDKNERIELNASLVEQLNNLISKQATIQAANNFQQTEMARSFISEKNYGNYNQQSAQVQSVIDNIIGNRYSQGVINDTDTYDFMKNAYGNENSSEYFKSELMRVAKDYFAEQGIEYKAGTLKRDGDNFEYEDLEGNDQTIKVSQIADRAAAEFMEKKFEAYMGAFGDQITENIEAIDKVNQTLGEKFGIEGLGNAFTAALNGDTDFGFLQTLPIETVDKLKDAIQQGNLWDAIPAEDWEGMGEDAKETFIKAIQEALDRDYSLTVAINAELHRSAEGMRAFNGLQQEYYEKGSISDDSIKLISDWLTSEGKEELAQILTEAVGTNKWELISDAINEIKDVLDKELPKTRQDLKDLGKTAGEEFSQKLHSYNVSQGDSSAGSADWNARTTASMASRSLGVDSTAEDLTKAIDKYKEAMKTAKSQSLKNSLEQDIKALEQWRDQLKQAADDVEYLTDVVKEQENEVFYVVNQANGTKDAMLLIGEGWVVAAEDAQKFLENCKNAELYIEQVNADGSLKINEAGITDMATRQFQELKTQIYNVEMELEAAQKEALLYAEGTEAWEEVNQRIERQIELLSILRAAFSGLELSITTAGTDHKKSGGTTKNAIDGLKSILDVYHDIDRIIKEITHDMTVLEKKSEFLTGKKLEKNLKAQLTLLQSQNKALQDRIKIAVNEAATLRSQKVNDDGTKGLSAYGVEFNKDTGEIENYYEVIRKKEAELETARLQFNKSRSDADEQHYNKVKKELDDLKQDISEYEKYLDDRRQMEEQIYDNLAKQLEVKLQHADLRIEAMVDLSKVKKQILDFQKNMGAWTIDLVLNPDQTTIDAVTTGKASRQVVKSSTKSMTKLTDSASDLADVIRILKDANADTKVEWEGEEYDRTAIPKLAEKLEEMTEDIQGAFDDIKSTVEDARNAYINALQELQNWNQKIMEHFDMTNGMYDHADKLTSLLYGEDSLQARTVHENIATQKTGNLYSQAVEANRIAKESYQEYLAAVDSGDKQVAEEAYSIWSENIQKLNSLTEDLVEARMNLYKTQVSRITSEFDMAVFNGDTMDEYISQWELLNKQADQYLDTINAEFGVEQLRNKYTQAYNKSIGNTKTREKINKIMQEELAMLKEKDKLTKYDLDRANAKYDLTLKQIALEEARENKTNLRLRRDSQGNYTYQYTANQEEIDKAQGEVDIAKNNLYNMDKERTNEMVNETLQLYKDFAAEREAILNDPQYINNQEVMNEKLKELQKRYFDKDNGFISVATKEYAVAAGNVSEDVDEILNDPNHSPGLLNSFETLVKKGPEAIDELVVGLKDPITDVMNKFIPTADGDSSIADGVKTCFDDCKTYQDQFLIDVGKFAKDLDEDTALGGIIKLYDEASTAVQAFKDKCEEGIDLTQIGSITSAINQLASAIGKKGDKTNPNLTGNAEDAFEALTALVKPDQIKTNLSIIKDNFSKLTGTVKGLKESFETTIGKVKDLFTLLDQYNNKKWSYEPNINLPSGGGGSSQRGDGTSNGDSNGPGGDLPKTEPVKKIGNSTVYVLHAPGDMKNLKSSDYTDLQNSRFIFFLNSKAAENYKKYSTNSKIYQDENWEIDPIQVVNGDQVVITSEVQGKWKPLLKQFDTGGYTGVWGDQGRLAMLHEKELILNKQDTQKFLDALDIVRQLDIGNLESNMYESFLLAQKKIIGEWSTPENQSATIQNITINADFPDASDRDEIKAAFDSLVNLASQRAYTKRH